MKKKVFMMFICVLMLSLSTFAYFIWDPLTFAYTNISLKSDAVMGPTSSGSVSQASIEDKVSLSMNNFAFMPLIAGFGYMPKDSGFYFMWENILGVGACKIKFKETDKLIEKLKIPNKAKSLSLDYVGSLIFGYAFSPINDLYISFGSGISTGIFSGAQSYDSINVLGKEIGQSRETFGVFVGLPLDVTARYFFTKHAGLLFGIQDIIMLTPIVDTNIYVRSVDAQLSTASYKMAVANNFTLKFGLSTRW